MSKKTFEFYVEDICSYYESNSDYEYVEPCEKDHICEQISSGSYPYVGVCKKYVLAEPSFGSSCEKNDDCDDSNLECNNKICTLIEGSAPITVNDNSDAYYYCPNNNLFAKIDTDGTNKCVKRENDEMNGLCKLIPDSGSNKVAYPDYMKVCGEIKLDTEDKNYAYIQTAANTIGSVSDGKFVDNISACKSGFALPFYANGETSNPTPTNVPNDLYQKCVQYNGIEYKKSGFGNCKIKYVLDSKSYYYDVDKIDFINTIDLGMSKSQFCSEFKFMDEKLELFKQYVSKVNELGNECNNIKNFDEPFTCKNDELRKLYYFYNNINEYLLYKNEDEVSEFLLQQVYPSYAVQFSKTDESKFLTNNFICLLILLLL